MKITESQLRSIIKKELNVMINEAEMSQNTADGDAKTKYAEFAKKLSPKTRLALISFLEMLKTSAGQKVIQFIKTNKQSSPITGGIAENFSFRNADASTAWTSMLLTPFLVHAAQVAFEVRPTEYTNILGYLGGVGGGLAIGALIDILRAMNKEDTGESEVPGLGSVRYGNEPNARNR